MGWRDEWPSMADGLAYDGKRLLELVRNDESPFHGVWDVNLLIAEIEESLNTKVIDIQTIDKGSNNYGIHLRASNRPDMVARIARGDVNMPGFDGFAIECQIAEVLFEAATYELLRNQSEIRASCLLYHRAPVQHVGPRLSVPSDLSGRRLFVFQRAEGVNNVWEELSADEKVSLLDKLAHIRAALFNFDPPLEYATKFLHNRLFDFKPKSFTKAVQSTREFWLHVFESKIEATIKNEGDMIGWEDDEETVGPIAFAAKRSLLCALPHLMPPENAQSLYRLVLEHGDFGIHNTSITKDVDGKIQVTSLYDWETGCIVPALLSDPLVAVGPVDLITDRNARASVTRIPDHASSVELEEYKAWAQHYIKELYCHAPAYESAIRAGKDVRYLWYALRDWRGGNSEEYFGKLGAWAEQRMKELGVS